MKVMLEPGAYMPERAYEWDAGYDLRAPRKFMVLSRESAVIDTGVHIEIPKGYAGMLKSKSGLNIFCEIVGEGVIDAGYVGSIVVKLYNHGPHSKVFNRGDKIIQLVILPVLTPELELATELTPSDRGSKGFGSSGA